MITAQECLARLAVYVKRRPREHLAGTGLLTGQGAQKCHPQSTEGPSVSAAIRINPQSAMRNMHNRFR
eukprot:7841625-Alexandrium_andersonii.AAC.1